MSILDIWRASPEMLQEKSIKQIIAIAGNGKLADGNSTSTEFLALLSEIPSAVLDKYADECLTNSFPESGLALQDIINEVGRRLGFTVTNGRYRGKAGEIGNDGLWLLPNNHHIVVEVKTTDAYRVDLNTIADYRKSLITFSRLSEDDSSVLIVVGRSDTGDLEAQIRGSKYAWDMRLISVDGLIRLMHLKESIDDPDTLRRIHEILMPREFTKLDSIVDLVFSTAEDAKSIDDIEIPGAKSSSKDGPKFTPVAFNDLCAQRVSLHLKRPLLKRTRAYFSSPDDETQVLCAVSRRYEESKYPNYWFAFHPHQRNQLTQAKNGYVALGCGSPELIFLIPIANFSSWLDGMNVTKKGEKTYWHVQIFQEGDKPILVRKKGQPRINLLQYQLNV